MTQQMNKERTKVNPTWVLNSALHNLSDKIEMKGVNMAMFQLSRNFTIVYR